MRRIGLLVTHGVRFDEVFAVLAEELERLLPVDLAVVMALEADATVRTVAGWSAAGQTVVPGERLSVASEDLVAAVTRTGLAARRDGGGSRETPLAVAGCGEDLFSAVSVPLVVEGRLWGVMTAGITGENPLPSEAERVIMAFGEVLALAIADWERRESLARFADEQRALRSVATLVARGVHSDELFAAVTEAAGEALSFDIVVLAHFLPENRVDFVASWSRDGVPVNAPAGLTLDGESLTSVVARTGRPTRIDSYLQTTGEIGELARASGVQSGVAAPVTVEGRMWGVMVAVRTSEQHLPADAEERLASFTELLATSVANAGSRSGLARLAQEQAALRRVATLVAQGLPPEQVFAAVTEEAALLLGADQASLGRLDDESTLTTVAVWKRDGDPLPTGSRWPLGGNNITTAVATTGRPARMADYALADGPLGELAREAGARQGVATPVTVEGRVWGVMAAFSSSCEHQLGPETEERLTEVTELLAMAVANAESRAELAASRARIVAAADSTRRRIERDLHDGAQQRLVALGLQLRAVEAGLPEEMLDLRGTLKELAQGLAEAQAELRAIARGIYPAILSEGGLGPALKTLARRSPLPVELELSGHARLAEQVEVAAYYVVAEALTNAAKHSDASVVKIEMDEIDGMLRISVRDDGAGGANEMSGSGLIGLKDRVEALSGTIVVHSPAGAGTRIDVALPALRAERS